MEHLIPAEWFIGQPWWALVLIGVAAMYAVIKGADWLVEGASGIALRLGMSKVIVGATIVSLGTTSPECAVSVMAAWRGDAGLALGNAVGSIIADSGLIFGIGCLMMALPVDRFILNRQGWVQIGSGFLLAAMCYGAYAIAGDDARVARWMGGVLLGILLWYLWASVRWGRRHAQLAIHAHGEVGDIEEHAMHLAPGKLVALFILGLVLVIFGGHVLIECVKEGALQAGVPSVVIAATIVAFGTSLPELMVGITAIRKGHAALLIGNVIGADVLNVLFVIGAAAVAKDLPIVESGADVKTPAILLLLHLPTMLIILTVFRVAIFHAIARGRFHRAWGVPLLALYAAYLVMNFVLSR